MLQLVKDLQGTGPRGPGCHVIGRRAVGVAEMRQHHGRVEAIPELAAQGSCLLKAAHGRSQVAEAIVGVAKGIRGASHAKPVPELLMQVDRLLTGLHGREGFSRFDLKCADIVKSSSLASPVANGPEKAERLPAVLQRLAKPRLLLAYPGDAQVCAALARAVGELPAQLDGRMAMLVGSVKIAKEGAGVAEAPMRARFARFVTQPRSCIERGLLRGDDVCPVASVLQEISHGGRKLGSVLGETSSRGKGNDRQQDLALGLEPGNRLRVLAKALPGHSWQRCGRGDHERARVHYQGSGTRGVQVVIKRAMEGAPPLWLLAGLICELARIAAQQVVQTVPACSSRRNQVRASQVFE
jgi:hypothetical protein